MMHWIVVARRIGPTFWQFSSRRRESRVGSRLDDHGPNIKASKKRRSMTANHSLSLILVHNLSPLQLKLPHYIIYHHDLLVNLGTCECLVDNIFEHSSQWMVWGRWVVFFSMFQVYRVFARGIIIRRHQRRRMKRQRRQRRPRWMLAREAWKERLAWKEQTEYKHTTTNQ
jgi:hypothetical protein